MAGVQQYLSVSRALQVGCWTGLQAGSAGVQ